MFFPSRLLVCVPHTAPSVRKLSKEGLFFMDFLEFYVGFVFGVLMGILH